MSFPRTFGSVDSDGVRSRNESYKKLRIFGIYSRASFRRGNFMRTLSMCWRIVLTIVLSLGGAVQAQVSEPSKWSYYGIYNGDYWEERYFDLIDGAGIPEYGDEIEVTGDVNIRIGPIRFVDGVWTNQARIGVARVGERYFVRDVIIIEKNFIWVKLDDAEPNTANFGISSKEFRQDVLSCFTELSLGGDPVTIKELKDCSGVWVTPRVLFGCTLENYCPVLPDTVEGVAKLDSLLESYGLSRSSPIAITDQNIDQLLPLLPTKNQLEICQQSATSSEEMESCVAEAMIEERYEPLIDCFRRPREIEQLQCFTEFVDDADFTELADCMADVASGPDKFLDCTLAAGINEAGDKIVTCVNEAADTSAAEACFGVVLDDQQLAVAKCVRNFEADEVVSCLALASPEALHAQEIVECVREGDDPTSLVADCAASVFGDGKTGQTISCIAKAKGDRGALAVCAAGATLDPDTARLVGCATSSQGPTGFAVCSAAIAMNEEWQIAAECAVNSGGEPVGFVGCAAGRLTIREISKCLAGRIGEDCFGPNNTLVKGVNNAFKDLTEGPGKSNEIVKAISEFSELTGGPNSVVNRPEQILGGSNSMFNNPGQIWGGDNSVFNQAVGGKNSEARRFLRGFDPGNW